MIDKILDAFMTPFDWFYEILVTTKTLELYLGGLLACVVFACVIVPILHYNYAGASDIVKKGKKNDH